MPAPEDEAERRERAARALAEHADRLADWSVALERRHAANLRRLRQHPFGLAPDSWQPSPARIGAEIFGVSPGTVLAFLARSPVPRSSITLVYGNEKDLSAVLVEVITDFSRRQENSESLEYELWRAARRDQAAGPPGPHEADLPEDLDEFAGPVERGTTGIVVSGAARQVPSLAYRQYRAFRFRGGTGLVTVVTRHQVPEPLSLAPVRDLGAYADSPDSDPAARREALRQVFLDHPVRKMPDR
jgi:hypothetical protein